MANARIYPRTAPIARNGLHIITGAKPVAALNRRLKMRGRLCPNAKCAAKIGGIGNGSQNIGERALQIRGSGTRGPKEVLMTRWKMAVAAILMLAASGTAS